MNKEDMKWKGQNGEKRGTEDRGMKRRRDERCEIIEKSIFAKSRRYKTDPLRK